MIAMGLLGNSDILGMEGSGIVRRVGRKVRDLHPGDKVMVISQGICGTRVVAARHHCMKLPGGMDLSDAAAIGIVFATTIYSLLHVGQLRKGQVCLSALSISLSLCACLPVFRTSAINQVPGTDCSGPLGMWRNRARIYPNMQNYWG